MLAMTLTLQYLSWIRPALLHGLQESFRRLVNRSEPQDVVPRLPFVLAKAGYVSVVTLLRVEFPRTADLTKAHAAVGPSLWLCSQVVTSWCQ
jgi:hypothetical protein